MNKFVAKNKKYSIFLHILIFFVDHTYKYMLVKLYLRTIYAYNFSEGFEILK
jgi:hypothetical protein